MFFYTAVILLCYFLYRLFDPFLTPFAWAGVIVVFAYPWHERVEGRLGRSWAAAISTAAVRFILIVPALLVGTVAVREAIQAGRNMQSAIASDRLYWFESAWQWIGGHWPGDGPANVAALADEASKRAIEFLAAHTGAALQNVVLFMFELAVTLFATFFFFRDAHIIVELLRRSLPFERSLRDRVLAQARDLVFATVTSGITVASLQGLLGGLAFGPWLESTHRSSGTSSWPSSVSCRWEPG